MIEGGKVLINASNLHLGGGVQVAASFVSELVSSDYDLSNMEFWVSDKVYRAVGELGVNLDVFPNIDVVNVHGIQAFCSSRNKKIGDYSLVFTIFGPNYYRSKGYINVVGFAQAWIIDDGVYRLLSPLEGFKSKLKFFVQRILFKRANALVVELEHVRTSLCEHGIAARDSVYVVHNCISSVYYKPQLWRSLNLDASKNRFNIGFLGRDYPHKNTAILPEIKRILVERYDLKVEFFVTFNTLEWEKKSDIFRSEVKNVGSLQLTECPSYYQLLDAVIFPSLLECFSATPLEAMVMEKPLFASDRRFVKDVCGQFAFYFDPLDALSAASVIARYILDQHRQDADRLRSAREHALNFATAEQRASSYLQVIDQELAKRSLGQYSN